MSDSRDNQPIADHVQKHRVAAIHFNRCERDLVLLAFACGPPPYGEALLYAERMSVGGVIMIKS